MTVHESAELQRLIDWVVLTQMATAIPTPTLVGMQSLVPMPSMTTQRNGLTLTETGTVTITQTPHGMTATHPGLENTTQM